MEINNNISNEIKLDKIFIDENNKITFKFFYSNIIPLISSKKKK